jgi:excisionase family DNA binding protein
MSETKIATEHAARTEHGTGPEYESKLQLAARLGVSTRTIDNLMTRGLPYLALTGKLRRFPRITVDAWLRQQEVRRG